MSLSARRAWIEMARKPSIQVQHLPKVALRKESVDRNIKEDVSYNIKETVALRKESVDRNMDGYKFVYRLATSLSARRAWIEI